MTRAAYLLAMRHSFALLSMEEPNPHMQLALRLARQAEDAGEVPVGAVIVTAEGEVLAAAHNLTETLHDPTAHAEMVAIQTACKKAGSERLVDCDMFVTLEPCPMCATAIGFARIKRLYYGAFDSKGGGVDHGPRIFSQPTCNHRPDVYGGIAEEESSSLLRDFFARRRD